MQIPPVELHEPATLEEASALLGRLGPRARAMAGGTDVLVDLKSGRIAIEHLVSIARLDGLRGVRVTSAGLEIGALTTLNQLNDSTALGEPYVALRDATSQMAAPQIRNMATVGGNVAGAVPCADLPPVLMVLQATATLVSAAGERSVSVEDLLRGPRETALRADEILRAIVVPSPSAGFGAAYARFGLREGNSIAVAGVAAGLERDSGGRVVQARCALAAVSPRPHLIAGVAAALQGRALDDEALEDAAEAAMAAAEPISDVRGSADYRRRLVGVLTRRAFLRAADRVRR